MERKWENSFIFDISMILLIVFMSLNSIRQLDFIQYVFTTYLINIIQLEHHIGMVFGWSII